MLVTLVNLGIIKYNFNKLTKASNSLCEKRIINIYYTNFVFHNESY